MTHDDVMTLVVESICEETRLEDRSLITGTTTAGDVPGWDSLAHVRIMLGVEMELDITVPIETTYTAGTVGELVDLVQRVAAGQRTGR